jgi:glyoxylase-like metal-dependent hydrolase (beta-lactamase superfamily II)
MQRWQVGEVRISKIVESDVAQNLRWVVPEGTPDRLRGVKWLVPHFADEEGLARLSVHALVVESQGRRILVDTCVGNDKSLPGIPAWNEQHSSFLSDLTASGFAPDSIETVLCTHLHIDHVGWNTRKQDGRWVPTFPGARYFWNRAEYEFWSGGAMAGFESMMDESVRPVFDAGLVDLVEEDHAVTDEVSLEPTPGHTPGHVSVRIRSRGEEAIITGDLMHHPVQCAHPEWASRFDSDAAQAEVTRRSFLERHADGPVLVIGTHFAGATAGRIVRDGDAYRLDV